MTERYLQEATATYGEASLSSGSAVPLTETKASPWRAGRVILFTLCYFAKLLSWHRKEQSKEAEEK